jgi:hypothetical protein
MSNDLFSSNFVKVFSASKSADIMALYKFKSYVIEDAVERRSGG